MFFLMKEVTIRILVAYMYFASKSMSLGKFYKLIHEDDQKISTHFRYDLANSGFRQIS